MVAQIRKDGVHKSLGRFTSEEKAAEAYDAAARVIFGEHAHVNFPDRPSTEQAMAEARRAMDDAARQKRASRLRQREMEQKLRSAAAEAVATEPGGSEQGTPVIGLDRTAMIPSETARPLFDVTPTTWTRWQRLDLLPMPAEIEGESMYSIALIERLLRRCGIVALPYPDPRRHGVYCVPLAGEAAGGRVARVDSDAVSPIQGRRWRFAPSDVGCGGNVQTMNPAENIRLRHVVMNVGDGEVHIGHRNDDPFDCRRANLVVRTLTHTAANKRKQATFCGRPCTSRFKGVCWERRRGYWIASIKKDRIKRSLGRFYDEIAAAQAYDEAARELFGERARVNFPEGVDVWLERRAA